MQEEKQNDILKEKMDEFAHLVYRLTRDFPKEELYGVVSQLRRAALSIILNYIEGFARIQPNVYRNFLEISYGSLKEAKYLLYFSLKEGHLKQADYNLALSVAEEVGAMLWTRLKTVNEKH